ncbi:MAG: caspase family protein [Eubacteriales bacterium]|nr:caspase family protein [Eubacteriales bacterium]
MEDESFEVILTAECRDSLEVSVGMSHHKIINDAELKSLMRDLMLKLGNGRAGHEDGTAGDANAGAGQQAAAFDINDAAVTCVRGRIYALIASAGDYSDLNMAELPSYRMDEVLMETALIKGLKLDPENIRCVGADGRVTARELASAIRDFASMLKEEDTLIFYFSGHGNYNELIFSDMGLTLNSVLGCIDKLICRNKIVILDCCHSGDFSTSGLSSVSPDEGIERFSGRGIAVLAASAADSAAYLGAGDTHSLFTGIVASSMLSGKKVRKGLLSLDDIIAEVREMLSAWNLRYPDRNQQVVFRSNVGGTIYCKIEEYHPYETKEVSFETDGYVVRSVEPMSSPDIKRLCAYVVLKPEIGGVGISRLAEAAREIAESIRYEEVYSNLRSELKFYGQSARAVWCYFGRDESDLVQHTYIAYAIWASDAEMRKLYFKPKKDAHICEDIYVYLNPSYDILKRTRDTDISREGYIEMSRRLLSNVVKRAEVFIKALRELDNGTICVQNVVGEFAGWTGEVYSGYIRLSDTPVPPDDIKPWADEIMNLAGIIVDLALWLEELKSADEIDDRHRWLMNDAVRRYDEALEKIKRYETAQG